MKKTLILIAFVMTLAAGPGFALTAQQEKMKTCNADAKTQALKGPERKSFMRECLSAKSPASDAAATPASTQQEKMKTCNADAKGKKGAERKKFMSECLSGGTAAGAAPAAAASPTKAAPAVAPAAPVAPAVAVPPTPAAP